jgi:predicted MPP superfamily phosphohydrolase
MVWFFIIWITLLILVYIYIGRRLIKPAKLTRRQKWIAWSVIAITPLTQPFSFFLRGITVDSSLTTVFSWISYVGFGFFSLILVGLVFRDLILLASNLVQKIKNFIDRRHNLAERRFDPQRRLFLLNTTNIGVIGAAAFMTGYGIYEARRNPVLEKVTLPFPGMGDGSGDFKIAQFTDIHAGYTIRRGFIQSAVDQVNNLGADIIVFTGDMVDGSVQNLRDDVEPLKELDAPYGVYYVTGNHEYYSGAEAWIEEMDRIGFTVLLNDHKMIQYNQTRIMMAGVTDYRAESIIPEHKSDPQKAIGDATDADVKVLLAHQPKSIFTAADIGFDLQLSGHTHGGQYIPWSFLVTLDQPFIKGLNKHKNTWIYVNRGTGYWGPPVRVGIPSEVTLITLTNTKIS